VQAKSQVSNVFFQWESPLKLSLPGQESDIKRNFPAGKCIKAAMVRGQGNREVRSRDAAGEREEVKQGIKYSQCPLQVTEPGGSY
jgi:hypothetical protein